jgi:hypothetical protein
MKELLVGAVVASGLLVGCGSSDPPAYYPTGPSTQGDYVPPPASTAPSTNGSKGLVDSQDPPTEDASVFPELVERVKTNAPNLSQGGALAVRFENLGTGFRYSAILVADANPAPVPKLPSMRTTSFKNKSGEFVFIAARSYAPGHYECSDTLVVAYTPDDNTSPKDPGAFWSSNSGGRCELELYAGSNPGDVQGKLTASLISNDSQFKRTIEAGYLYIKGAIAAYGGPAPSGPQGRPTFTK